MKRFPVLTIWQPWASLIAAGEKRYETRTWKPDRLPVGSILMIHAGKANGTEQRDAERFLRSRFPDAVSKAQMLWPDMYPRYPQGAIIAATRFLGAYSAETICDGLSEQELLFGGFTADRYAWELEVLKLPEFPIVIGGKQGIWWWEGKLA